MSFQVMLFQFTVIVHVQVIWKHTSRKVLTTEWIEGEQLVRSSPEVIARLVPVGVQCFLKQLLDMAFFHADPHPGNLLVDEQGRLTLIDFGLCATVPAPDTRTMTDAIVHLMDGQVPELLDDAIELGFLPKNVNKRSLLSELQRIIEDSKMAENATGFTAKKYAAIEGRRKKFKEVSRDLNAIFFEYPFLVPDYFALITRALIVLEGIAVVGNPDFDIFSAAYPYALRRSLSLTGQGSNTMRWWDIYRLTSRMTRAMSWWAWAHVHPHNHAMIAWKDV